GSASRSAPEAAESDRRAASRRFDVVRTRLADRPRGRAAAADGDVLRPRRLDGAGDAARSRGAARGDRRLPWLRHDSGAPLRRSRRRAQNSRKNGKKREYVLNRPKKLVLCQSLRDKLPETRRESCRS